MRTRLKPAQQAQVSPVDLHAPAGPIFVDGSKYLAPGDLMRLELLRNRMERIDGEIKLGRYRAEEIQRRAAAEVHALTLAQANAAKDLDKAVRAYLAYKLAIEGAYTVSLDHDAPHHAEYDDETGQMFVDGAPIRVPTVAQ